MKEIAIENQFSTYLNEQDIANGFSATRNDDKVELFRNGKAHSTFTWQQQLYDFLLPKVKNINLIGAWHIKSHIGGKRVSFRVVFDFHSIEVKPLFLEFIICEDDISVWLLNTLKKEQLESLKDDLKMIISDSMNFLCPLIMSLFPNIGLKYLTGPFVFSLDAKIIMEN